MPTLQGLPQEILEIIFLYSMNISLPRASHDLGSKLSSKSICLEFCMSTLFRTVDHKAPIRTRSVTSDPVIQSELLTCRFFTYQFFLLYVQKAHDALVTLRGKAWANTGVNVPDASYFDGLLPFRFVKITYLGFAEGFQIPEKLLHGSWNEGKSSLLYVLVSLGGEIDWAGSMAGETAKEGIRDAVRQGTERAVAALAVLLGISGAITTGLLRYAVVDCGCNENIIRHLLFNAQILYDDTPRSSIDFHDSVLWQWADSEDAASGKGKMLKDMLKSAEQFSLQFYKEGETDWKSIVPFPYSGEKFDARAAFGNRVREMLARLYRNYGRRITTRARETRRHSIILTDEVLEEMLAEIPEV
jgi:hypothetical protein